MNKQKILVVDDEPDVQELVEFNLANAGFSVVLADNGADAIAKARTHRPDLIVLDVMMPEMDGTEACKLLRRDPLTTNTPILMLTARAAEIDRVLGLELGADDYVTKPFSPRELILRIRGLLKRHQTPPTRSEILQFQGLTIDIPRHHVTVDGQTIILTATEFRLLSELASNPGRVLSREQLLRDVWGYSETIDTRTVDTHMRRLREKLGSIASSLDTVRGVGYRFNPS